MLALNGDFVDLGISYNPTHPAAEMITRWVIKFFEGRASMVMEEGYGSKFGLHEKKLEDMDADFLIAIGGDGTILHCLQHTDIPILSINAGDVAFLSEIQPGELDIYRSLTMFLDGKYKIDERMKIDIFINDHLIGSATNEAVIHTTDVAKIRKYEIAINSENIARIKGDGVIVSTATGSTCYAMSAGGPIVDPTLEVMVIVPVNPFRTPSHPLVVDASNAVTVRVIDREKRSLLVIDGQKTFDIDPGSDVKVVKSNSKGRFVRFNEQFFKSVSEKLLLYSVIL